MVVAVADPRREYEAMAVEIDEALLGVARSGYYVHGPEHAAFEQEFAAYIGTAQCVATANGTDALELVLRAVGAGPGREVVTVANAGGYTSTAARSVGAIPTYVDVDARTLLLDVSLLDATITPRTLAVVVTHLYGQLHPDIEALAELCAARNVALIEDCAQAHGARRNGRTAGSFGTAATFSFYPTKNLGALGDGGAITTNESALADRLRALRQYGWTERYRATVACGRNSRLDELQAAVLRVKLAQLDGWNTRRRSVVTTYRENAPGLRWIGDVDEANVAHLAVLRTADRARFVAAASAAGVGSAVHFPIADHHQPAHPTVVALPLTESACEQVVSLPCHAFMTGQEIGVVSSFLSSWHE